MCEAGDGYGVRARLSIKPGQTTYPICAGGSSEAFSLCFPIIFRTMNHLTEIIMKQTVQHLK